MAATPDKIENLFSNIPYISATPPISNGVLRAYTFHHKHYIRDSTVGDHETIILSTNLDEAKRMYIANRESPQRLHHDLETLTSIDELPLNLGLFAEFCDMK